MDNLDSCYLFEIRKLYFLIKQLFFINGEAIRKLGVLGSTTILKPWGVWKTYEAGEQWEPTVDVITSASNLFKF